MCAIHGRRRFANVLNHRRRIESRNGRFQASIGRAQQLSGSYLSILDSSLEFPWWGMSEIGAVDSRNGRDRNVVLSNGLDVFSLQCFISVLDLVVRVIGRHERDSRSATCLATQ